MRTSNAFEKLLNSCINTSFVIICFSPFYFVVHDPFNKKAALIILFFIVNSTFLFSKHRKFLGMHLLGMTFAREYKKSQYFIYCLLYTISFSTLLFSMFFPFDLLFFNLTLIQLPAVLLTKTTLHGYMAGGIITMKTKSTNQYGKT